MRSGHEMAGIVSYPDPDFRSCTSGSGYETRLRRVIIWDIITLVGQVFHFYYSYFSVNWKVQASRIVYYVKRH